MKVIFLGTNGWYNTETGNTPCVLVDTDKYYIVFDAGDGIHKLDGYIHSDKPVYLFLSHFHVEHISGLHILNKFRFKQGLRIYGQTGTRDILKWFIAHPFTCPIKALPTKLRIRELSEGVHRLPFRVTCRKLLHGALVLDIETPSEAAKLAKRANVKRLVLFHFSAAVYKSIKERKEAEKDARAIFKNTVAAVDGMQLSV